MDRASAALPSFGITNKNASAVSEVCHRLDGIPLAIELAAARVKVLSVEKINERLDDGFRLLTGGSRTALPRQQTLRALIDWSYNLLAEAEQSLLRRLSVFAGGWTLEAAEGVCAGDGIEDWELLDRLTSLVEKSLVIYEEGSGEGRYRLLETVRQYSRDRLLEMGEAVGVRGCHLQFFLNLAEEAELKGTGQRRWLERLETEHDNLRSALAWAIGSDEAQSALRLGGALHEFWVLRGYHSEGRDQLLRLLQMPGAHAPTAARAKALCGAGHLAWSQHELESARALLEESLVIRRGLQDKSGIAASLLHLGSVAHHCKEFDAARALLHESLEICRELGDRSGIAFSLHTMGWAASDQGDLATARTLHEESLTVWREMRDRIGAIYALDSLGCVTFFQGELETARSYFEEALAAASELGDKPHIAWGITHLGWVAQRQEDYASARALYETSLPIWRALGYKQGLINTLNGLAWVTRQQSDPVAARPLYEEMLAINQELEDRPGIAWSLVGLGWSAHGQGELGAARAFFGESLAIYWELDRKNGIVAGLEGLAALAVAQGQPERSAYLFGAAEALREAIGRGLPPAVRAEHNRTVAAARATLGEEAYTAAWAKGRAMTLEVAVRIALEEREIPASGGKDS